MALWYIFDCYDGKWLKNGQLNDSHVGCGYTSKEMAERVAEAHEQKPTT